MMDQDENLAQQNARLQARIDRLEAAQRAARTGDFYWDAVTGELQLSKTFWELLGQSSPGQAATQRELERVIKWLASVETSEETVTAEFEFADRDGSGVWLRFVGSVDPDVGVVGSVQDFTQQHGSERVILESKHFLRKVIDLVPHEVFAKDSQGTFVLSNRTHAGNYGRIPSEVVGKNERDLSPCPEEADGFRQDDLEIIRTGEAKFIKEEKYTDPNGRVHFLQTHKIPFPLVGSDEIGVLGVAVDVTDARKVEQELRSNEAKLQSLNRELEARVAARTADVESALMRVEESERRLAAILDNTSFLIGLCDGRGHVLLANHAVCESLGHPEEAWLGKPLWEGPAWPDDETRQSVHEMYQRAAGGEYCRLEVPHVTASGEQAIFDFSVSPIRDKEGKVVLVVPEGRDISALKRIESELAKSNDELEAYARSVAHDLRAPVRAIEGFAIALAEDYGDKLDEEARDFLHRIQLSAHRMDRLIADLGEYTKLSRSECNVVEIPLQVVIDEVLDQLHADITSCNAQIEVDGALPPVNAHRATLTQVVANLISNAIKFVPDGRQPHVRISCETRQDGRQRLWVEDNGIGISDDDYSRIFKAFERLHGIEAYPGTGIGLAIVARASERMGGDFGVESEVGKGSRFWVELGLENNA